MKRVLCFGDSNTWGYISGTDHLRYDENTRWTRLLGKYLGESYEIIEEGLNSRTICSDDNRVGKEGRNGYVYLKPCLDTHDKIDYLVLMLGTNELKHTFNNEPVDILNMLIKMTDLIKDFRSQIDKTPVKLIICGLPPVNEDCRNSKGDNKYLGASSKCVEFNRLLEEYCKEQSLLYVSNDDLEVGIDGIHITDKSHERLANKLYNLLKTI